MNIFQKLSKFLNETNSAEVEKNDKIVNDRNFFFNKNLGVRFLLRELLKTC